MSFIRKLVGGFSESVQQPEAVESTASTQVKEVESKQEETQPCFRVSQSQILLNQVLPQKKDVLKLISDKMQELGFVSKDYFQALYAREKTVSTYLVNGVAIPHGVNEAKSLVENTGVVIVQLPCGVEWNNNGDLVYLAVGIAAKGDEHLALLQKLTTVVMDEELSKQLANTTDVNDILKALNQDLAAEHAEEDYSNTAQALVVDEAGLHARPASLISELAAQSPYTKIRIRNGQRSANAKSMASLIAMGAQKGDELIVSAEGERSQEVANEIAQCISNGLDEECEDSNAQYNPLQGLMALPNVEARLSIKGAAASPGIAIAPLFKLSASHLSVEREAAEPNVEKEALTSALALANEQLKELQAKLQNRAPKEAAILKAQQQLLSDELILEDASKLIEHRNTAAWSIQEAIETQLTSLSQVENERLKARMADLKDVRERVLSILLNTDSSIDFPTTDFILVATDLSPSQTAGLEGLPVKAICTELGGPNSHMAILARALGIPAIVGLGVDAMSQFETGEFAIVDPQGSQLIVAPDSETSLNAKKWIAQWQTMRDAEASQKHQPSQTLDGHTVEVVCNIAKPEEAEKILDEGGEGAGLLRTEFLFEASASEPTVEEQMTSLKAIVSKLGDRQLVVRTSDIGGDKPVKWMDMPHEDNPFLGVRGIRLSFKYEDVFRRQLEAIYATAKWQVEAQGATGIHIMFPMIAKLSEWQWAKDIADQVRSSLNAPVVPLGIMIEVPSAVLIADHFAKEVDFFSVGSNDLTQYTLAMDRLHPDLCKEADNYHPAILNMIAMTVKAANAHGKWVGVCGNMAADPNVAALLVGIGVHELSVSPANVAAVKNIIRSVSYEKLKCKADKALQMGSSESVMALYKNHDDLK
jgi:phosphocarrier protein FPr